MQWKPKHVLNRLIYRTDRSKRNPHAPNTIDLLQSTGDQEGSVPMRLVYAKEISRDRMIFLAVHQSLANKRNEKIIQPEKIQREIDNETAGLT
jgi:hypothetical protein